MTMKVKDIIISSALMLAAVPFAGAQNLDPTVVVNRAYEGKLVKMNKASLEMAVPDSVSTFALDFDYLVFDKPYKGADGFVPSVLTMKPAPTIYVPSKFYLKAGAGYTLHPTLDFVWSPFDNRTFMMDVYAKNRSYVGNYIQYAVPGDQDYWSGYDVMSQAGIDGRWEMDQLSMTFDVAYYGIASKDWRKKRMYDALDVRLGVLSKPKNASYFIYDVSAGYRFAEDKIDFAAGSGDYLGEHLFDVDATLGQIISGGHGVMADVETDFAVYSYAGRNVLAGDLSIVPRYVLRKGSWALDAGVRLSAIVRSQTTEDMFGTRGQGVYPAVKASFAVIPDAMRLYADIGGGNKLNTYASLLDKNHHADTQYAIDETGLMNITVERVSAALGVEGRIGSVFSYDLHAGYVNYASDLLDAVAISTDPESGKEIRLPGFGYASYQKCFASADWRLATDDILFDGNVQYTYAWGLNSTGLLLPAALAGDARFEYNWNKRIFAGLDCGFSTGRHGDALVKIPGYVDLGVSFEYAFNRAFSLWARGGNLLNMSIQRNPLYAEKGVSFTVGICLNL